MLQYFAESVEIINFVVMLTVIGHIEYLVRHNDCVVVPSFGAFIAHRESAHIQDGMIYPPKRSILFNAAVNHNDALLVTSIMRKSGISYDAAVKVVEDDVLAMKTHLSEVGELTLGNVGRFTCVDDVVSFEPSEEPFGKYFGLSAVALPTIDDEIEVAAAAEESETHTDKKSKDIIYIPLHKNIFRIAASIAVVVLLSFVLSGPIHVGDAPDMAAVISTKTVDNRDCQKIEKQAPEVIETKAEPEIVEDSSATAKYFLIVASFKTLKQAQKFVDESDLTGLKIMDKKGNFYKVCLMSASSFADVENRRLELAQENVDCWIYSENS